MTGGEGVLLWWGDAIGLGAAAMIGSLVCLRQGLHPMLCAVFALLNATFGGLTRDVLCGFPIGTQARGRILHSEDELYACCPFIGASTFLMCRILLRVACQGSLVAGMLVTVTLRWLARSHYFGLPSWEKPSFTARGLGAASRKLKRLWKEPVGMEENRQGMEVDI
jgi:uncharacterized membrane protein YeiH